eukprot:CAMPEP_0198224746 /NCGR_PEP_ID=MMETSP1445-20131203/98154_1 /TAXON_ID=36898 /ORGANISM="Pyramimonas sp., Strain CCMP2087" /LENGTH=394 /DNA_ID=CAMNT_0043904013 /DNA_START=72 /DNA_END=1256 /DNA_ORIENTATION=-
MSSDGGDHAGSDNEEEPEYDLSMPDVVTKYKAAAEITNKAIAAVVAALKAGSKVVDLCTLGDECLSTELAKAFNKKNAKGERIEKSIAFPTCLSINNCVCHFSPSKDNDLVLKDGDVCKIDLGCQIDGFIAVGAHTVVLQDAKKVTGRAADAIMACKVAVELAMRMMKPGCKASEIPVMLETVATAFDVKVVDGVLSHQMKRFVIDGNKVVINKPSSECKVEECKFEENEVYALDIAFSTGEGKPKVRDEKDTTVYKRALDKEYNLKMKASRFVFSEINKKYPTMPFCMRNIEDSGRAKLGLVECLSHELLHPYPVLYDKEGVVVAHCKATVLVMPNGIDRITSGPETQDIESDKKLENEELLALLTTSLKTNKKKNKKKADKAAVALEGMVVE